MLDSVSVGMGEGGATILPNELLYFYKTYYIDEHFHDEGRHAKWSLGWLEPQQYILKKFGQSRCAPCLHTNMSDPISFTLNLFTQVK